MKTVIKKEHAELFDVEDKDGYTLAKNGVKYYISLQKHLFVCTDIDVPDDVVEVAFSSPATIKIDRGINKSFPNVKTLIIDSNVDEISIPNELFPNVIEVISYNDNYFSGPTLIHINEFWGDTALYNSFCLREDATLDLSRVEQINDYALSGCMTKQIIWCRSALHIRPHAFDGSVFDNMQPQNGVVVAGNILVDIDHDAQEIEIPSCVYNMDYSRVQLATVPKLIINNIDGMRGIDLYGLSGIVRFTKQSDLYGDEAPFWRKDTFKNTYRIEVDTDSQRYKSVDGILYSKDGKSLLKCPTKRTGKVIIPNGVTEISACAFEGSEVESVTFPDSLKKIKRHAFEDCEYLKDIDFGNGIEVIGLHKSRMYDSSVFNGCSSLKHVTFPKQIKEIGRMAFKDSGLEKVELNEGLKLIGEAAFAYCKIKALRIPASVYDVDYMAFAGVDYVVFENESMTTSAAFALITEQIGTVHVTAGNESIYIMSPTMKECLDGSVRTMDDMKRFAEEKAITMAEFLIKKDDSNGFKKMLEINDYCYDTLKSILDNIQIDNAVCMAYLMDKIEKKREAEDEFSM